MAVVMDGQELPVLEAQFMKDLERWQSLFTSDIDDLWNFRNAVASIWGINLRDSDCAQNPDPEALLYFQDLARSLMDDVDYYFDIANLEGSTLLSRQAQWRSDCNTEPSHRRQDNINQSQTFDPSTIMKGS